MAFIVIEKHGGWEHAAIVTDEAGTVKVFNELAEALRESDDCQDGLVVGNEDIDIDIDASSFLIALRDNTEVIKAYLKDLEVPVEVRKALNNLVKLKSQIVA